MSNHSIFTPFHWFERIDCRAAQRKVFTTAMPFTFFRYQHPEFLGLMIKELWPELKAALDPTPAGHGHKLTVFAGHDACPMMPWLVAVCDSAPLHANLILFLANMA